MCVDVADRRAVVGRDLDGLRVVDVRERLGRQVVVVRAHDHRIGAVGRERVVDARRVVDRGDRRAVERSVAVPVDVEGRDVPAVGVVALRA